MKHPADLPGGRNAKNSVNNNNSNNKISKRSNVMNTTRFFKNSLMAVISLMLIFAVSFAGNYKNKGTLWNNTTTFSVSGNFVNYSGAAGGKVNNPGKMTITGDYLNSDGTGNGITCNQAGAGGEIDVTGNYTNSAGTTYNTLSGATLKVGGALTNGTGYFSTDTLGLVNYTAAAAPQSVLGVKYGALTLSGGGGAGNSKTLAANSEVLGAVTIAAATVFDENGKTLTLDGSVTNGGTFTADGTNSTTIYNGSGAQSVMSANYYNLTIQNTNTKTAAGDVTVVLGGSLSVAASTTFDLLAHGLTLNPTLTSAVSNGGTIKTAKTGTAISVAAVYQIGGTVIYNDNTTGSQTIAAVNYNNLSLDATGGSSTRAFGAGTIGIAGTYTPQVGGTVTRNYGTSTVNYNGSAAFGTLAQNVIGGETYNNLGVSGGLAAADTGSHKTVTTGNIALNGGLGTLTIGNNTNLDMKTFTGSWAAASTLPSSSKIMWAGNNAFVSGLGVTELNNTGSIAATAGGGYGSLLLSGTSCNYTLGGNVTVSLGAASIGLTNEGSLTVANLQTLTVTGLDFTNDGTVTNNGVITLN